MGLKNPTGGPFSTNEVAKILRGKGVIAKADGVSSGNNNGTNEHVRAHDGKPLLP